VPLRFIEVLEAIRPDIDDYLRRRGPRVASERFGVLLQLRRGTIPRALEDFYGEFTALLDAVFEDYLLHGGFPKAVLRLRGPWSRRTRPPLALRRLP